MPACAYCHSPLGPADRSCASCGAPRTVARASTPPTQPGFERWVDAWAGFSVDHPANWSPQISQPGTVRLVGPEAEVAIGRLAPRVGAGPREFAELLIATFPEPRQVAVMRDEPRAVTLRVEAPPWTGQVQVRMAETGGGLFVQGRARDGSDIHTLCNQVLSTLAPVEPAPRTAFREPGEGSFHVACPQGWEVGHTFVPRPSGRLPWCRVFAGPPGHTFVACEMEEPAFFVDKPLPEPEQPKGFWANLGRMVEQVGEAFSGAKAMPAGDMTVVLEHHFVPLWMEAIPGSEVVDLAGSGPIGMARIRLPDGVLRVVKVESAPMPVYGAGCWCAGMSGFYQCPEPDMPRLEPILRGVLESFVIDPRWRQAEQARRQQQVQMQHQMRMQQQQHQFALHQQRMASMQASQAASNATWQAGQDVLDMQMAGWRAREGLNDTGHAQAVHGVHGTADYVAPSGQMYTGADADRMFVHQGGDVFVGGGPGLEMGLDWTELKKL